MSGQTTLAPQAIAQLPLLQQSTRPDDWRRWFEAMGVTAPLALSGPRFELFSMTAAAAAQGLGLALVPRLLIEAELARGELVIANLHSPPAERYYYLVQPDGSDAKPVLQHFTRWLRQVSASR